MGAGAGGGGRGAGAGGGREAAGGCRPLVGVFEPSKTRLDGERDREYYRVLPSILPEGPGPCFLAPLDRLRLSHAASGPAIVTPPPRCPPLARRTPPWLPRSRGRPSRPAAPARAPRRPPRGRVRRKIARPSVSRLVCRASQRALREAETMCVAPPGAGCPTRRTCQAHAGTRQAPGGQAGRDGILLERRQLLAGALSAFLLSRHGRANAGRQRCCAVPSRSFAHPVGLQRLTTA